MNILKTRLKEFKLAGMLNSLEERINYANDNSLSYSQFLELLCEDEVCNRQDNSHKKRYAKKDYHDLFVMIREPDFLDTEKLTNSIKATFNRRGTPISLSINFDSSGIQSLQALWRNHLRGLGVFRERLNLPDQIDDVINEVNGWVKLKKLRLVI